MKITDLNGKEIAVINLSAAIEQSEFFKDCYHEPPNLEIDKRLQTYWADIYYKLTELQKNFNTDK